VTQYTTTTTTTTNLHQSRNGVALDHKQIDLAVGHDRCRRATAKHEAHLTKDLAVADTTHDHRLVVDLLFDATLAGDDLEDTLEALALRHHDVALLELEPEVRRRRRRRHDEQPRKLKAHRARSLYRRPSARTYVLEPCNISSQSAGMSSRLAALCGAGAVAVGVPDALLLELVDTADGVPPLPPPPPLPPVPTEIPIAPLGTVASLVEEAAARGEACGECSPSPPELRMLSINRQASSSWPSLSLIQN